MAQYESVRSRNTVGVRTAEVDQGLRAHMNRVYGLMSVAMLLTGGVAWAVGTAPSLMAIFRDPVTMQPNILGWAVMFAPLIMVFAFAGMINRMSAATAQLPIPTKPPLCSDLIAPPDSEMISPPGAGALLAV